MSAPDISCFDFVIGLYHGDCNCYGTPPPGYNYSNSGLYISQLIEPSILNELLNCDQGSDVWVMMEESREEAIRRFISDTNALLLKNNILKRQPFYGGIGRAIFKKNLSPTGTYAGVRFYCADVVSGYIKITNIGTLFNSTGNITLMIYNNLDELIDTLVLNTTANTHQLNSVDIELPLHSNYAENLEYYFVYQVGASLPKNNDIKCHCGVFKPIFNINNPYYQYPKPNQYGWANYMMVGGINLNSIDTFMDITPSGSNYMNGLTFKLEIGCKVVEVYCRDELDFERNTLAQAMGISIQHKSGELFVNKLLSSPNISREILINTDQWKELKEEWRGTYNEMTNYISSNLDVSTNDCFECKDIVGMMKAGIMA